MTTIPPVLPNVQCELFRSDITIVCKGMQFSRFPLDEHKCLFKLSSCEYLGIVWWCVTVTLPQLDMTLTSCVWLGSSATRQEISESFSSALSTGTWSWATESTLEHQVGPTPPPPPVMPHFAENYSIYGVEIVLTRVLSPYILSVYLPSAMFVVMSWVRRRTS